MKSLLTKAFILALSFLLALPALAKIRLVEWHTKQSLAPMIIPVRDGETPEEASKRYLNAFSQNPDLEPLFEGQTPVFDTVQFKELDEKNYDSRALMVANKRGDYTPNGLARIRKFRTYLSQKKQAPFLLPFNANLGLNQQETSELFNEINTKFPFLILLGGDDVDTSFYNEPNLYTNKTIPSRDRFEINLVKSYVTSSTGFLLGVCRGSQLASIALGYKLIQDVPAQVGTDVAHKNDWHDIKLLPTSNSILQTAASTASGGELHVNSLHHQSVLFTEGGPLEIAARSSDGVTEATEFKNGRGILLQFHPELMENDLGFRIISGIVNAKNRALPQRCSRIFSY